MEGREYFTNKDAFAEKVTRIILDEMKKQDVGINSFNVIEFHNLGLCGYMVGNKVVLRTGYEKEGYFLLDSFEGILK